MKWFLFRIQCVHLMRLFVIPKQQKDKKKRKIFQQCFNFIIVVNNNSSSLFAFIFNLFVVARFLIKSTFWFYFLNVFPLSFSHSWFPFNSFLSFLALFYSHSNGEYGVCSQPHGIQCGFTMDLVVVVVVVVTSLRSPSHQYSESIECSMYTELVCMDFFPTWHRIFLVLCSVFFLCLSILFFAFFFFVVVVVVVFLFTLCFFVYVVFLLLLCVLFLLFAFHQRVSVYKGRT